MGNAMKLVLSWLGLLGILVCVICIFGIWYAARQVDAIREQLFDGVETSFSRIESRIESVEQVLDNSQVTVESVQQNLQQWTIDEASENLKARLQFETRAEQLVDRLEQTEAMLAASGSTVEHVGQLLGLGEKAGLPLNRELVENLSEQILVLQSRVAAAQATAEDFRLQVAGRDDAGESLQTRKEQIGKLAVTLLASFTQLDQRLSGFAARTTETREAIGRLNANVRVRIFILAAIGTFFFLWMAMGQMCMWRKRAHQGC